MWLVVCPVLGKRLTPGMSRRRRLEELAMRLAFHTPYGSKLEDKILASRFRRGPGKKPTKAEFARYRQLGMEARKNLTDK
jgi:hypothetical protein